jgi:hypothetical protein
MHEEHAKPLVALADCLTALQAASRELERDPTNATAVRDYNFGGPGLDLKSLDHLFDAAWTPPEELKIVHPSTDRFREVTDAG